MKKLVFYRQQRQDGGIRTAVSLDDTTLLHHFQSGGKPSDPALLWYLDLRCEGKHLPDNSEEVLKWFHAQGPLIRDGLTRLADKLAAGLDADLWPLRWNIPHPPRGVRMTLVCSAVRRQTLLDIATHLREVSDRWEEILESLDIVPANSSLR